MERLELERDGDVLRVWLNRPDKRNAHDQQMIVEVGDLFRSLETEFDVRLVVITRAFRRRQRFAVDLAAGGQRELIKDDKR